MRQKYAYEGWEDTGSTDMQLSDTLSPTSGQMDDFDQGILGDMASKVGDKTWEIGESTAGKALKGTTKTLGVAKNVADNVVRGMHQNEANRDVGKAMAKNNSLNKEDINVSDEARERLDETLKQMSDLMKEAEVPWGEMKNRALVAGAGTLGALGLGAGVRKAGDWMRGHKAEKNWESVTKENPDLAEGEKAREHFDVLKQFAPDLATNPSTTRSFLTRMQRTGMAPHEFVNNLTDTQNKVERNRLSQNLAEDAGSALQTGLQMSQQVGSIQDHQQRQEHHEEKQDLEERRLGETQTSNTEQERQGLAQMVARERRHLQDEDGSIPPNAPDPAHIVQEDMRDAPITTNQMRANKTSSGLQSELDDLDPR